MIKTLCMLILNVIDNGLACDCGVCSFDYDIPPILQEIFSLKWVVTSWYVTFMESYYFLCVKKTTGIEQIYRNRCPIIRKFFIMAYLNVQNILFYNFKKRLK